MIIAFTLSNECHPHITNNANGLITLVKTAGHQR